MPYYTVSMPLPRPAATGQFQLIVAFNEATSVEPLMILKEENAEAMLNFCKQWDFDPDYRDIHNTCSYLYLGDESPDYGLKCFEKDNYAVLWSTEQGNEWVTLYRIISVKERK